MPNPEKFEVKIETEKKETEKPREVEKAEKEELERRVRVLINKFDKNKSLLDDQLLENLKKYLHVVKDLDKKEVNSMTPEEMIKKTKEFLLVGAKNKDESSENKKRPEWLQYIKYARKFMKNGDKIQLIPPDELINFLKSRGVTDKEIRTMKPNEVWIKGIEIYTEEQK